MKNVGRAFLFIIAIAIINFIISGICYKSIGMAQFKGYAIGTFLSFVLSLIWILGAIKGIKSNTMVLLSITLGGFPVRLIILGVFAYGGIYIARMNTMYFAIAFLMGTILSLIVEIWFFNTISVSTKKKLQ